MDHETKRRGVGKPLILFFAVGAALLLGVDQLVKYLVIRYVMPVSTVPIIENVFHLTYLENYGAAFGVLQNKLWIFIPITVVFVGFVVFYLVKRRPTSRLQIVSLTLLVGGALGNFLDRIVRGYVVDMFDFRLIHFAIFNCADVFVVVGTVLLALYLVFVEDAKKRKGPSERRDV